MIIDFEVQDGNRLVATVEITADDVKNAKLSKTGKSRTLAFVPFTGGVLPVGKDDLFPRGTACQITVTMPKDAR